MDEICITAATTYDTRQLAICLAEHTYFLTNYPYYQSREHLDELDWVELGSLGDSRPPLPPFLL